MVEHRRAIKVGAIVFEAFPVEHSVRAPAVGYRISRGRATILYVPDVVYIHDWEQALEGAKLYVGDGATVVRSMVRRRGDTLFGHAPVRTQLTWCQKEGVSRAIFTHCGTELVAGDEPSLIASIEEMACERRVRAEVAYDGMEVILR